MNCIDLLYYYRISITDPIACPSPLVEKNRTTYAYRPEGALPSFNWYSFVPR